MSVERLTGSGHVRQKEEGHSVLSVREGHVHGDGPREVWTGKEPVSTLCGLSFVGKSFES